MTIGCAALIRQYARGVWTEIAVYLHQRMGSPASVAEDLYAAGFDIGVVMPRFLPYSLRGRFPTPATVTRIYLRYPALSRLAGKQFLVIATKPG
jgi:hypothetical protein